MQLECKNMCLKASLVLCCVSLTVMPANVVPKNRAEVIGFPEQEEDERLRNKENRLPVYIPARCPINELFYPGDQADDWICDCRPGYLYHPESDQCWSAYRQGPCLEGSYLALLNNTDIPTCEKNPCKTDGLVHWPASNKCEKLGSSQPCLNLFPVAILGVNATTLKIECIKLSLGLRFGLPESSGGTQVDCTLGAKRKCSTGLSSATKKS